MSSKVNVNLVDLVVKLYTEEHYSSGNIVLLLETKHNLKVSRSHIIDLLKFRGIDTRKGFGTRVATGCELCGKKFDITRSRFKATKSKKNFCSKPCYHEWLKSNNFEETSSGRNQARNTIKNIFGKIPKGAIVHHIDGNQNNNKIQNLMLLKSQADHVAIHRQTKEVIPIFVGSDLILPSSTAKLIYNDWLIAVINKLNAWSDLSVSKNDILATTLSLVSAVRFAMHNLKSIVGPSEVRRAFEETAPTLAEKQSLPPIFNDQSTYLKIS
jgi:hypothetical protein